MPARRRSFRDSGNSDNCAGAVSWMTVKPAEFYVRSKSKVNRRQSKVSMGLPLCPSENGFFCEIQRKNTSFFLFLSILSEQKNGYNIHCSEKNGFVPNLVKTKIVSSSELSMH